jgi:hypothetical protein
MHLPWNHSESVAKGFSSGFGSLGVNEKLEKSLSNAAQLHSIAQRKGINILEPFTGVATQDGCFRIIGPTQAFYEELLPQVSSPVSLLQRITSLLGTAKEAVRNVVVSETLAHETLRDDGTTTANNNTSVISMLTVDGHSCLLTADAGIPALEQAAATLEAKGFVAGSLGFVQVPHHGSRRNVGPSVLDRLLGPKGQGFRGYAFVSAPPDNPEHKHPAKKVTNAFLRRGYPVHATQGLVKWHSVSAPQRSTFITSQPLPFHDQVEEDTDP